MLVSEDEYLAHEGVKRKSGRYPWGSGERPYQHESSWMYQVRQYRKAGMSEKEIAEAMGLSIREFRARNSVESAQLKRDRADTVRKLKEKGWSNAAIAEELGISLSTVAKYQKAAHLENANATKNIQDQLRESLDAGAYLDVGKGTNTILGVPQHRLDAACKGLEDEGYTLTTMKYKELGTGDYSTVKVLAPKGATKKDAFLNRDTIEIPGYKSTDGGLTFEKIKPNADGISSKRVKVVYAEDGGTSKDGLIEIRPGVQDLSLGGSSYAQVRIAVDGTHYLKGMAIYNADLPDGVDVRFNTNKKKGTPVLGDGDDSVLKQLKSKDNPFKSTTAPPEEYIDKKTGKRKRSAVNKVREEGDWDNWSNTLSAQVLSKQSLRLARDQLAKAQEKYVSTYEKISKLNNPVIKKKMLEDFANEVDAAASHLKAASLPRQRTQVLIPMSHLKDTEIYAPNFRDGERVALIRYPHAGTFEIPQLTVNNKNPKSKKILGNAFDAVGINSKVAERLSGADFDGDTVLVIPNNKGKIKSTPALRQLAGFTTSQYKIPAADLKSGKKKVITPKGKQNEMGRITNLIADMQLQGATASEVARAVKHSMVVIDAEKHELDYRKSERDNDIAGLRKKYQSGGASTLITRAKSTVRVPQYYETVDKKTGKKTRVTKESAYYTKKDGTQGVKTKQVTRMSLVDDANKLSTGTPMERVYAAHANSLKALANKARADTFKTPSLKTNASAKKVYAKEVESLKAKLNLAYRNKPLERRAQLIANTQVKVQKDANPWLDADDVKKLERKALAQSRAKVGAHRNDVKVTPREWEAIQAGAISGTMLLEIINNGASEQIKNYATPKRQVTMTTSKVARARALINAGRTRAEVADALGVSVSTLNAALG